MADRSSDLRRAVLTGAREVARRAGSPTVEAEHLLLALTRDTGPAGAILMDAGLDDESLRAALEAEFAESLRAVGVVLDDFQLSPVTPVPGTPRVSTSAKTALHRAVVAARARGDRRITSTHLLLGLARARGGTLPRALALAGVDAVQLAAQAEAALDRAA